MTIRFDQLVPIYENTVFDKEDEDEGTLTISSQDVVDLLNAVEGDEAISRETGIFVLDDNPNIAVGQRVRVRCTSPRSGIGVLVRTFDDLINSNEARFEEPKHYYVRKGRLTRGMAAPPSDLVTYREILSVMALFSDAAAYVDRMKDELVFIDGGKFSIPIKYGAAVCKRASIKDAKFLVEQFSDPTHQDQKLEILAKAMIDLSRAQPQNDRLEYLLANLSDLSLALKNGYRLFASSFSYAKVRRELETARIEYVTKIHKTVVDIQSQLLGIPVATVIVASQLKVAKDCGLELWADVAVLSGAWIFLGLLMIAIINQWMTLGVIKQEIDRQKAQFEKDYADLADQFTDIFRSLGCRIWWHRGALAVVAIFALAGAWFATVAYQHLVAIDFRVCIWPKTP